MATLLGVGAAFAIWVYRELIDFFGVVFREQLAGAWLSPIVGALGGVLALALAGALVGWLMGRFVGDEKVHGVAGVIEGVNVAGGRLPYRKLPVKALSSSISLGAGASTGPEDPSVQIGANLGSWLCALFRVDEDHARLLVAAGVAAAVASAFKAPIAGVFFALEVVLNGVFEARSFSIIVLASVVPRPAKTALAGAIVGVVGLALPGILGIGREEMNAVLGGRDSYAVGLLLALGVAKIVMTAVSIGGGFVGGVFAPSLFVGTMFGAAYGHIIGAVMPTGWVGVPQEYAIAGMAAVMAGVVRAPMTAVLIVFELTNDYRLILPIMLTTVICVLVAERFERDGLYLKSLKKLGIVLPFGREIECPQISFAMRGRCR
ncbi:MAG: chloride channel protein [Anaerolineae bacterium]|nr:chloride channel protein [Anaerolineae bacterium]